MDLTELIDQYSMLKKHRDTVHKRVDELNQQIKDRMLREGNREHNSGKNTAILIERNSTTYDRARLIEVLKEKGLLECIREVPDEQLVESAYLNGDLTDEDLREIRRPVYNVALHVKDVQS